MIGFTIPSWLKIYVNENLWDLLFIWQLFFEVLQSLQHSQQQMMEEIHQMKADKTKEKGSQHDLEHAADKEETLVGGAP